MTTGTYPHSSRYIPCVWVQVPHEDGPQYLGQEGGVHRRQPRQHQLPPQGELCHNINKDIGQMILRLNVKRLNDYQLDD